MPRRRKTVEYCLGTIPVVTSGVRSDFPNITLRLPEANKTFVDVLFYYSADDSNTAAGTNITERTLHLTLNGVVINTSVTAAVTHSGENISWIHGMDRASQFTTNWPANDATATLASGVTITQGTVPQHNVTCTVVITYDYDDESAEHIKTVYIPLYAQTGSGTLPQTTRPEAAMSTIPALNTFLPESGKTIRDSFIVFQANTQNAAGGTATTNHTFTMEAGTLSVTPELYQASQASDRWVRYCWKVLGLSFNEGHEFRIWNTANLPRFNHPQIFLVVTYTFDPVATTTVLNSVLLPMELDPIGIADVLGSQDDPRHVVSRTLDIAEPGPISIDRSAFLMFWQQRIGTTFVAVKTGANRLDYAGGATVLCGGMGLMHRVEQDITLVRGRNVLQLQYGSANATNRPTSTSGYWMINYRSGKAAQGVGAHNHTVRRTIYESSSLIQFHTRQVKVTCPVAILESEYYINSIGFMFLYGTNGTVTPAGLSILVERLAAEGGPQWEQGYSDIAQDLPEVGMRQNYATLRDLFMRFPGDPGRMDPRVERLTNTMLANLCSVFFNFEHWATYHTITHTISGSVTGSDGEEITLDLVRSSDGQRMKRTTRMGDGPYTFTWYDDTTPMHVTALGTGNSGRSSSGVAV
jgi:hypothetical protein